MPGCGKNNTSPAGAVVAAEWGVEGLGWGVWGGGIAPGNQGWERWWMGALPAVFEYPLPAMEPLGDLIGLALGADGGRMRCQVACGGDQDVRPPRC